MHDDRRINLQLILYILAMWFVISIVTNILGPLMPVMVADFKLSLTLAGLLPFSFFLAYGLVSIPAGALLEAWGTKRTLLLALGINLAGSLLFALFPGYVIAILSLFALGVGMAMLQVVINPLMRVAGGEGNYSFFSVLGQLVFGLASYAGADAFVMVNAHAPLLPIAGPRWSVLYWLFAAIFLTILVLTSVQRLPPVELRSDERTGPASLYLELIRMRGVQLFFLGIAAYVGTEQSLANWMSQFLADYHAVPPETGGAAAVGQFWGLMAVGCLIGLALLKLLDARVVLAGACIAAMATLAAALLGSRGLALAAFPMTGLCLSVMFSIVFSLAINSIPKGHGALSGILCSGIVGGAIMPLIVGAIGQRYGLRIALSLVFVTLAYMLALAIWARPLIRNQTMDLRGVWRRLRRR